MRTITAFVAILLSIRQETLSICSSQYGSAPCKFLPSYPGTAPPCAKPGLTYCEHPTQYPGHLIERLIQNSQYDHKSLLNSESTDEFSTYVAHTPKPVYGPPANSLHHYQHISKPQQPTYNQPGHYIPSLQNFQQNYSDGYHSARPNYVPELDIPANHVYNSNSKSGLPNRHQYSNHPSFSLPQTDHNNYWKRYARDLFYRQNHSMRQRRSVQHSLNYYSDLNATSNPSRLKRQIEAGQQLCQTRTRYIMPRVALNNKGSWMYVVNMPEVDNQYTQLVKSEVCLSQECNGICGLPIGYTSMCEQKFAQKRLIALEEAGNQLYSDVFWFPSCCLCTITRTN